MAVCLSVNTFHTAGVSRRRVKSVTKCSKISQISGISGEYIWNHHEKCIKISSNVPGICTLIREIDIKIQKFEESKITFGQ